MENEPLGTRRDQKGEYITAGEGQAAVPSTKKYFLRERISTFMKGCFKPFLFVQLAVTMGKRALQGKGRYRGHILPIGRYYVETLIWTDLGDSTAYGMGL